jgi:phosphohistidine swiveling domain-containing protein
MEELPACHIPSQLKGRIAMQTADQVRPAPIVPPPNFRVTWENPADEGLLWGQNSSIESDPITPMSACILAEASTPSFNMAAETYEGTHRTLSRRINTHHYYASVPVTTVAEELEALSQRSQARVEDAMARLGDWWRQELLPEIAQHLAVWDSFDLQGASLTALVVHLEETVARMRRVWEIELLLAWPHLAARSMFEDLYADLFGAESVLESYRLLQGFDNKTLETNRALWRLSRMALPVPAVRSLLEERAAADVLPTLDEMSVSSSPASTFLTELRGFLQEYGQRDYTRHELADPSWFEDPAPVIRNLQLSITQPDRDPQMEMATLVAEREQVIAGARERLQGYPGPIVERFEFLLKAAQEANIIAEDHNFWIDGRSLYRVRRVLLEWGHRLASAALIEQPSDVFYLTLDELREIGRALAGGFLPGGRHREVAARQAEMAYYRTITPPRLLGTPPAGRPAPSTLGGRALGRFVGTPPQQDTDPRLIRGHAGSAGLVRGPAMVIATLAEADKLRQGEVLVTRATAPAWTPLFATAAAIVTDTGGVLSHCAVVAREYRLPAVVGTGVATARIRDGQMLEVDGTAGIVRILS